MRRARCSGCALLTSVALLCAFAGITDLSAQGSQVILENQDMVFLDIEEEMVTFEWSVDVRLAESVSEPQQMRIIFDLLDDDDRPINRDDQGNPLHTVRITVEPGRAVPVVQRGRIAYDLAAEVITYACRWEIIQGPR